MVAKKTNATSNKPGCISTVQNGIKSKLIDNKIGLKCVVSCKDIILKYLRIKIVLKLVDFTKITIKINLFSRDKEYL